MTTSAARALHLVAWFTVAGGCAQPRPPLVEQRPAPPRDPPPAASSAPAESPDEVDGPRVRDESLPTPIPRIAPPFALEEADCVVDVDLTRSPIDVRLGASLPRYGTLWRGPAKLFLREGAPHGFLQTEGGARAAFRVAGVVDVDALPVVQRTQLTFGGVWKPAAGTPLDVRVIAKGRVQVSPRALPAFLSLPVDITRSEHDCRLLGAWLSAPPARGDAPRPLPVARLQPATVTLHVTEGGPSVGAFQLRDCMPLRILRRGAEKTQVEVELSDGELSGVAKVWIDHPRVADGSASCLGRDHATQPPVVAGARTDLLPFSCPMPLPVVVQSGRRGDALAWKQVGEVAAKTCVYLGTWQHLGAVRTLGVDGVMPNGGHFEGAMPEIVTDAVAAASCREVQPPKATLPRRSNTAWQDACRAAGSDAH